MKLPPNFAREWIQGPGNAQIPVSGWKVRVGNRAVFLNVRTIKRPGGTRAALEKVLGLKVKPPRTADEIYGGRARQQATMKRHFRNRLAHGPVYLPWNDTRRTLKAIKNEEQSLAIAMKWQKMGEYRK